MPRCHMVARRAIRYYLATASMVRLLFLVLLLVPACVALITLQPYAVWWDAATGTATTQGWALGNETGNVRVLVSTDTNNPTPLLNGDVLWRLGANDPYPGSTLGTVYLRFPSWGPQTSDEYLVVVDFLVSFATACAVGAVGCLPTFTACNINGTCIAPSFFSGSEDWRTSKVFSSLIGVVPGDTLQYSLQSDEVYWRPGLEWSDYPVDIAIDTSTADNRLVNEPLRRAWEHLPALLKQKNWVNATTQGFAFKLPTLMLNLTQVRLQTSIIPAGAGLEYGLNGVTCMPGQTTASVFLPGVNCTRYHEFPNGSNYEPCCMPSQTRYSVVVNGTCVAGGGVVGPSSVPYDDQCANVSACSWNGTGYSFVRAVPAFQCLPSGDCIPVTDQPTTNPVPGGSEYTSGSEYGRLYGSGTTNSFPVSSTSAGYAARPLTCDFIGACTLESGDWCPYLYDGYGAWLCGHTCVPLQERECHSNWSGFRTWFRSGAKWTVRWHGAQTRCADLAAPAPPPLPEPLSTVATAAILLGVPASMIGVVLALQYLL